MYSTKKRNKLKVFSDTFAVSLHGNTPMGAALPALEYNLWFLLESEAKKKKKGLLLSFLVL